MTIDLGRTDPHSILWEPFQAGITSARTGTGSVFDVMEAAVKPYIQEELGTRTLLDIARNKMEKGGGQGQGMVYNPESDLASKVGQIGGHILKGLEPGIAISCSGQPGRRRAFRRTLAASLGTSGRSCWPTSPGSG
jgi:hypothetical protein